MISGLIFILFGLYTSGFDTQPVVSSNPETEKMVQDSSTVEAKMEIHGLYEHRNLFVSNPLLANGKRCITRAPELNGLPMAKVTDANALEIKLSEYELELGDVIKLVIWHSPECKPVVINPEVIDPSN